MDKNNLNSSGHNSEVMKKTWILVTIMGEGDEKTWRQVAIMEMVKKKKIEF